jgi:hypothetical protein
MRRLRQIALYLVVLSASMFACVPDPLDVDGIPVIKPQIVVSTQIIPDESLVVLLTKSFGALEPVNDSVPEELIRQIAIEDAIVTISGPSGTDTLLALGSGVYGAVFIPFQADVSYTLKVVSESLGEVSATTTAKPLITFEDIKAELYYNGFDDTLAQITHTLRDPEGENWYMLNVQEVEREDIIENIINPRAFTRLLSDEQFDGKIYNEMFRVVPRDYSPGDTIAVSLSNINKDYYDFVKLRLDNRFSLVEFLGEPINYPSNVKNGKGFFNLYIPDFRFFVLE